MKTHLIPDLEKFGIWDDDYDTFFKERAKLVSEEIKKGCWISNIFILLLGSLKTPFPISSKP